MRLSLAFLMLAAPLVAKEYFVNKGVRYHIGDSRYGLSSDVSEMETYPVVGTIWEQEFKVDRVDKVRVRIDHIWGVDDCPYCKVIISIDDWDMGRLSEENNHEPFNTLVPLAKKVEDGHVYKLRIASYAKQGRADDFVIQDVVVETDAVVTFLPPVKIYNEGAPLPTPIPEPQRPSGGCKGDRNAAPWLPESAKAKGMLALNAGAEFREQGLVSPLDASDYVELYLRLNKVEQGDLVGQAFEAMLGTNKPSGWVLSFAPGKQDLAHANLKLKGVYRANELDSGGFRAGQWNTLRVARCPDGSGSLFLNGRELGRPIPLPQGPLPLKLRLRGLGAEVSERPY